MSIRRPRAALELGFDVLNLWGGVAIGEHLGQILTCLWLALVAAQRWHSTNRLDRVGNGLAVLAIAGISVGLGEGLSVALGSPADLFSLFTILGYLAFSAWMVTLGLSLLRTPQQALRGLMA